jgi:hypothetical protein
MEHAKIYKVEAVEEVHSGDDIVLLVNLGVDNLLKRVRARLQGVDTPDAYKATSATDAGKVRDWVRHYLNGKACHVEVHSDKKGCWIVTLYITEKDNPIPISLNKLLQDEGYVFRRQQGK